LDSQEIYLNQLKKLFWENGYLPQEDQLERLALYASLVVEKNNIVNLISRKDIDSVVENHVFISAFIHSYIPVKASSFLDIGTGGGFPGIPLAIVKKNLQGILIDSTSKKINAVKEFIDKLKLGNVAAVNDRVENPEFVAKFRNSFDLIVSRATVPLLLLIRYAIPLVKEKSYLAAIKGGDLADEIQKAESKYRAYIKKLSVFELAYKPSNIRNEKGKKLILLEINK